MIMSRFALLSPKYKTHCIPNFANMLHILLNSQKKKIFHTINNMLGVTWHLSSRSRNWRNYFSTEISYLIIYLGTYNLKYL